MFFYKVFNPLHVAIEKGNSEIVKLILEKKFIDANSKYI